MTFLSRLASSGDFVKYFILALIAFSGYQAQGCEKEFSKGELITDAVEILRVGDKLIRNCYYKGSISVYACLNFGSYTFESGESKMLRGYAPVGKVSKYGEPPHYDPQLRKYVKSDRYIPFGGRACIIEYSLESFKDIDAEQIIILTDEQPGDEE